MELASEYRLGAVLGESPCFVTRRAWTRTGEPVIARTVKPGAPRAARAQLRHGYEIARALAGPGVVAALGMAGADMVVLEDRPLVSLRAWRQPGRAPSDLASIVLDVADALSRVHARGYRHGEVTSDNVLIDSSTGAAAITGFERSSSIGAPLLAEPCDARARTTLAYAAPEQIGRMARGADHRSDLYALGVILYELLADRLPFPESDPLTLVHAHMARSPTAPHELPAGAPLALSAIALKLLSKQPEARYQSAFGLAADLRSVLDMLRRPGDAAPFVLGQRDAPARLSLPSGLHGRDGEQKVLLEAFARVAVGQGETIVVSGVSGVGKSALIESLRPAVVARGGLMVVAKHDQLGREVPLGAVSRTLDLLARHLLTEPQRTLDAVRADLASALGPTAGVIVEIAPSFALVLGATPPPAPLGAAAAERRLHALVAATLRVIAATRPLVLVLDDLQWVDRASLRLVEALAAGFETGHLLFLLSLRDEDLDGENVDEERPLHEARLAIGAARRPIAPVSLEPLGLDAVEQLLAEALCTRCEIARPLARSVWEKTRGNVFFVREFLGALAHRGLLSFDHAIGSWTWSLERIVTEAVMPNVAALLERRLRELPAPTRELLSDAAALGYRFSLEALARVADRSSADVTAALAPAVAAEIVVPVRDVGLDEHEDYVFQHDRLQETAYEAIPSDRRAALHRRLGRGLLGPGPSAADADLFAIASHFNRAVAALDTRADRVELATLNLRAAHKARASAAHEAAWSYLSSALAVLPPDAWASDPSLALDVHIDAAEAAYSTARYDDLERILAAALPHTREPLDRVRLNAVAVRALGARERFDAAIELALVSLRDLGIRVPTKPSGARIAWELARARVAMVGRSALEGGELRPMTDPNAKAAIGMLDAIGATAYVTNQRGLYLLVTLSMLDLTWRLGFCEAGVSGIAIVAFAMSGLGDVDRAAGLAEVALEGLARLPPETPMRARALNPAAQVLLAAGRRTQRETLLLLDEAARAGVHVDPEWQAMSAAAAVHLRFFFAHPLSEVAALAATSEREVAMSGIRASLGALRSYVTELADRDGASTPGAADAGFVAQMQSPTGEATLQLLRGLERLLAGDPHHAVRCFAVCERLRDSFAGSICVPLYESYQALALLALDDHLSFTKRAAARAKVLDRWARVRFWARHAPDLHAHRAELIAAEWSRVTGGALARTLERYARAAELARAHGFRHDEALAYQLRAQLLAHHGREGDARASRASAHRAFSEWGAHALAARLERLDGSLRDPEALEGSSESRLDRSGSELDLCAVMRAAQGLSSEIVLEDLLATLMRTMLEVAGATRGVLLLYEHESLALAAEAREGSAPSVYLDRHRVYEDGAVPLAVALYVQRTREEVVIDNVATDARFRAGPSTSPAARSALALPIERQGALQAVLYLENEHTTHAFTIERIGLLRLLAAQAAISLENAQLYAVQTSYAQALEREVAARTRELREALGRLRAELTDAASYVRDLLPDPIPDGGPIAVDWRYVPTTELGGDTLDYFWIDASTFAFYVLDVCGHGVAPALQSLAIVQALRGGRLPNLDLREPSSVCRTLNDAFPAGHHGGRHFTLWYGVYNTQTHVLRYASAGHPAALLCSKSGEQVTSTELQTEAPMVGVVGDAEFVSVERALAASARLFVLSDGVYEARRPGGSVLPYDEVASALRSSCKCSRTLVLDRVLDLAYSARGKRELADDFSLLVIDFHVPA